MATWKKVIVSGSEAALSSLNLDNALTASSGGTGITSYSTGDILYASSATALSKLAVGSNADVLTLAAGVPSWATPTTGDISSISLASNGGLVGTSLTGPIPQLSASINDFAAGTVAVADDSFAFLDNDDSLTKKESISDLVGLMAGTNVTASSGTLNVNVANWSGSIVSNLSGDVSVTAAGVVSVNSVQANSVALTTDTTGDYVKNLGSGTGVTIGSNSGEDSEPTIAVDYGSGANNAVAGANTLEILGTANEVDVSGGGSTALGAGNYSATIGLPSDVTIANDLTVSNNAVISGDLEVSGTASFKHSENLDIADQFITLASGSTSATDGGIVIAQSQNAGTQVGEGFGYDSSLGGQGRWGVTSSLDNDTSTIIPKHFMVTATSSAGAPSADPVYGGSTKGYGNIYVNSSTQDIYIYS